MQQANNDHYGKIIGHKEVVILRTYGTDLWPVLRTHRVCDSVQRTSIGYLYRSYIPCGRESISHFYRWYDDVKLKKNSPLLNVLFLFLLTQYLSTDTSSTWKEWSMDGRNFNFECHRSRGDDRVGHFWCASHNERQLIVRCFPMCAVCCL